MLHRCQVVTNLLDAAAGGAPGGSALHFSDRPSQLDLLSRVLSAGMEEAGVENIRDEDAEGLAAAGGRPGARRRQGDMAALSGGAGYRYLEFASGGGRGGGRGRGGYQGQKAQSWARKLGVSAKR